MISLYAKNAADFSVNGIVLDNVCIQAKVTRNISGIFVFEGIFLNNCEKSKELETGKIIKAPTPKGEQLFRIKSIYPKLKEIKIIAQHIFYDLEGNFIDDTFIVDKNGQAAINQILDNCLYAHKFSGHSDIAIINSSRLVSKNIISEALLGDNDNSFINRWGGEVDLDNFDIYINTRLGSDRGYVLEYAKNITGYDITIDESTLITAIEPQGYDGLRIPEKYVYSSNFNNYAAPHFKAIEFTDVKVKSEINSEEGFNTEEEAQAELRRLSEEYFTKQKVDLPTINAKISMVELSKTEQYKGKEFLERLFLGDTLKLNIPNLNLSLGIRLFQYEYNCLTKRYSTLELGDIKDNYISSTNNIQNSLEKIETDLKENAWKDILKNSITEATKLMQEGLKNSYVIARQNEIIIGDTQDISTMVNCLVLNKNGIGYSNSGYHPDALVSAWTIDGKFNASCITTGKLLASLIKVGILSSANNKSWIDMENGTFNFANKIKFDGYNFTVDLSTSDLTTNDLSNNTSIKNIQAQLKSSIDNLELKVSSITTSMGTDLIENGRFQNGINLWYESNNAALTGLVYYYNGIYWYKKNPNIYLKQNLGILSKTLKYTFACKAYAVSSATFNLSVELYKGVNLLKKYAVTSVTGTQSQPFVLNYVFQDIDCEEDVWIHISGISTTTMYITQIEFFEPTVGNYATVESVSKLATDLNGISAEVSRVETSLNSSINLVKTDVSSLSVKATSIETKVTSQTQDINSINTDISAIKQNATSIESKVTSQGDRLTTAESTITQQAGLISTKVGSGDVKSIIEQNPNSVKIGFNGINDKVGINYYELYLKDSNGKKSLRFYDGKMKIMTPSETDFGFVGRNVWAGTSVYGLSNNLDSNTSFTVGFNDGTYYSTAFTIVETPFTPTSGYLAKGIHFWKNIYTNGYSIADYLTLKEIRHPTKSGDYINCYASIDMHWWYIRNASMVNTNMLYDVPISEETQSTYGLRSASIVETVSRAITPNTEFLGEGEIIDGECVLDLPAGILGRGSYSVFLTALGNKKIWLEEKTDRYFKVCGEECTFDFLIKCAINDLISTLSDENYKDAEPISAPTYLA